MIVELVQKNLRTILSLKNLENILFLKLERMQ